MAKAKRIKTAKEPILHVHKYVVVIHTFSKQYKVKYRYAFNLKDVKEYRDSAPKGAIVDVFKANHEFKESWEMK